MDDLFLIAVNLTRRCNLACEHCYMDAETRIEGGEGELGTAEVEKLLAEIAERSDATMVVLTGGEPLLRRDLEQLVRFGSQLGLAMVVGTNGVLLTEKRVKSLKEAGVMGMGISLDSLEPDSHDSFRGCPGSWQKTLDGMDLCKRHKVPFQVHFSVTEKNAHEVQSMIDFATAVGAHVLNIFFLVCTGRGESMSDITPLRYEQVLQELVEAQEKTTDLIIRARCAPHYKRVAFEKNPESPLTRAEGYEGGGCLAGIHYCRVTPEGGITACPYIPDEEGSIRETGFWDIWDNSPTFKSLRNPDLGGKCGRCEFQKLCGGCRARPLALGNSLMDEDPWCAYTPRGEAIIQPLVEMSDVVVTWSEEAQKRLQRVPGFLRKMVRKRAETHVRELGENEVTPEHMAALASKRFANGFPGQRPGFVNDDGSDPDRSQTTPGICWTQEAQKYRSEIPSFLREGVVTVAEEVALSEGRLEVNIKLLNRLEGNESAERKYAWSPEAEALLSEHMASYGVQVRMFVLPTMEAAAERQVKLRRETEVTRKDVESVIETTLAGVEWDADALERVKSAPEFVRAGIKKAAEFSARREGLAVITPEDLTRFRNRAMMKAVRRIKGFGKKELNFDVFAIAKSRVPRLKENVQAERRFGEIREYVESRQNPDGGGLGLMDRSLIEKMKAELKK